MPTTAASMTQSIARPVHRPAATLPATASATATAAVAVASQFLPNVEGTPKLPLAKEEPTQIFSKLLKLRILVILLGVQVLTDMFKGSYRRARVRL